MTGLAGDLDVKLACAVLHQRINRAHDFCKVHGRSGRITGAGLAVEVPEIHALGQCLGAFTLGVFADVVFGGIQKAVAVFAFDVELVGFFHGSLRK